MPARSPGIDRPVTPQDPKPAELLEEVRAAAERVRNDRPGARDQLRAAVDAARAGGVGEETLAMATRDLPAEPESAAAAPARPRPRLVRMQLPPRRVDVDWGHDDG
jgi:hypothetical protein